MQHPPATHEDRVLSRADLLEAGLSPKRITKAVREGRITRLRRDHYVLAPDADADRAVRLGGRTTCVTALASTGAFLIADGRLHVHVDRHASRLRAPDDRKRRWNKRRYRNKVRLHWVALLEPPTDRGSVALLDAVRALVRCRPPREVIATLDSMLHLGLTTLDDLTRVFDALPRRYRVILRLLDGRSESGTESLVRIMLRQLGASPEVQVEIDGVGRVDFVIAGLLIVECDSRAHHGDWEQRKKDIRRDQAAAIRGYTTVRLLAEDILYRQDEVRQALAGILAGPLFAGR